MKIWYRIRYWYNRRHLFWQGFVIAYCVALPLGAIVLLIRSLFH